MSFIVENPHYDKRWLILGLIGAAQFMVAADVTIVNIALPTAQRDLGFSDDLRQWIVTAYALTFGALLLFAGRLSDLFGRKATLVTGLLGFAVASAVGGAAQSFGMLVAARVAQGACGALLAPAALALLTTTFTDERERGKAIAVFGTIATSGLAVGLLLGGILTETLSWRWTLYVNLAIAVPATLMALRLLVNQAQPRRPPLDVVGTLTASVGLFALIYGFSSAERSSWDDPVTIATLATSIVLLAVFVTVQSRAAHPLLPLRVPGDRTRGGANLAIGLTFVGMFAVFLFLTYYLQQIKGFTPIEAGLAFVPMTLAVMAAGLTVNTQLLHRIGPRPLLVLGLLLGGAGMLWLAQLQPSSPYAEYVLPALIVLGAGVGTIMAPAVASATYGLDPADSGVASALVNAVQQVGGAVGLALMSTIAASATTSFAHGKPPSPETTAQASVHGYTVAFYVAAGIFLVAALLCGSIVRNVLIGSNDSQQVEPDHDPAPSTLGTDHPPPSDSERDGTDYRDGYLRSGTGDLA